MNNFTSFTTTELIKEVAMRLQKEFQQTCKREFEYGFFKWIFHQGKFQSIETHPMWRSYFIRRDKSGCA